MLSVIVSNNVSLLQCQPLDHVMAQVGYFDPRPEDPTGMFYYPVRPLSWREFDPIVLPPSPPRRSSSTRPRRPRIRRRESQFPCLTPSNAALHNTAPSTDLSPSVPQEPDLPQISLYTNDIAISLQTTKANYVPPAIVVTSTPAQCVPASSTAPVNSPPSNTAEGNPNLVSKLDAAIQGISHINQPSTSLPGMSVMTPLPTIFMATGTSSDNPTVSSLRVSNAIIPEVHVTLDQLNLSPNKQTRHGLTLIEKGYQMTKDEIIYEKPPKQGGESGVQLKKSGGLVIRWFGFNGLFKKVDAQVKDELCEFERVVGIRCSIELARRKNEELEESQHSGNPKQKLAEFINHLGRDIETCISKNLKRVGLVTREGEREAEPKTGWKQRIRGQRNNGKRRAFDATCLFNSSSAAPGQPHILRYNVNHMSGRPLGWVHSLAIYAPGPPSLCCSNCTDYAEQLCTVLRFPSPVRHTSAPVMDPVSAIAERTILISLPEGGSEDGFHDSTQVAGRGDSADIEKPNSRNTVGDTGYTGSPKGSVERED
jgi:hypothetical protein